MGDEDGHKIKSLVFTEVKPGFFIKSAPENPVLWTGMKDASAESRKKPTRC